MLIVVLGLFVLVIAVPHTDEEGARKALIHSGYKPISVGGYDFFGGGKDDFYKTKFTAVAPNGDVVSGCVTKGAWGKGSTVRLND